MSDMNVIVSCFVSMDSLAMHDVIFEAFFFRK